MWRSRGFEAGAPESGISSIAAAAPRAAATRRVAPLVVATAVVAIAATFGLTRWLTPVADHQYRRGRHVSIALPDGDELGSTNLWPFALSDDGTRVAYVGLHDGKTQIYVRTLSESVPKALDGTEGGDSPFFSPDGQWIAFFAGSKLRKIAVGGAALQTLADAPLDRGGAWGGDGYIYFAPTNIGGIWRVPEGGGTATEVTRKDPANGEISHRWPHDRRRHEHAAVCGCGRGRATTSSNVAMQTIGAAEHHVLVKGGDAPRYAAKPGLLLYARLGELFAVPWRPLTNGSRPGRAGGHARTDQRAAATRGSGNYAVSGNGTLAYIAADGPAMPRGWSGSTVPARSTAAPLPERDYENATVSPDGTRAIVQIREATTALWMYDLGSQHA